jgi:ankyrin repeat protein
MFITRGMRQGPYRHYLSLEVEPAAVTLASVAASGDVERLRYFLAAEEESPPSEETIQYLLASASWAEEISVVEYLLAEYPPGKLAEEPIRAAIYSGSMPLVSAFLRVDPDILLMQYDRQGSALIAACRSRQRPEFIRFLLEAGADPNQDPDCAYLPPLGWAAGWYQKSYPGTEVIDMLLDYGAETEHSGALRWAARGNHEDVVRRLLERGADHEKDSADHIELRGKQSLALHEAASRGYIGVMRILLEHGVDVNCKSSNGKTALEEAEQIEEVTGTDLSAAKELLTSWNQVQA